MTEVRTRLSEPVSAITSLRANMRGSPLEGLLNFRAKLATIHKGDEAHHLSQTGETSVVASNDDGSRLAIEVAATCASSQTETDSGHGTMSSDCDTGEPTKTTLTFSRKPIPQQYLDRLFDIRALFTESLLNVMSTKQRPTKGASMKFKYGDHDDSIYLVIQCDKRDKKRLQKFFARSHVKETIGDDIAIHVTTGLRQLAKQELKVYKRALGKVTSGTTVKITGTNRSSTATIGGAISILKNGQKVLYGMTAGHVLNRLINESSNQPSYPCNDPGGDSDASCDSDESYYSSDDDQSEVLPGLSSQPIFHIGTITEHSLQPACSATNHDWALVELCPDHSFSDLNRVLISSNPNEQAQSTAVSFKLLKSAPTRSLIRVIVPTSRGNLRGTLTPSTSGLLVAPGCQFVETHDVVLDEKFSRC